MKITLPLPPNMANGRFHWRVKENKRKTYFETCDMAGIVWNASNKAIRRQLDAGPPKRARLQATVYCGGQMDHDNCLARLKWPVDWLVRKGYLIGDKPSQLEWVWPIEQVVGRKQQYRVEFELDPA